MSKTKAKSKAKKQDDEGSTHSGDVEQPAQAEAAPETEAQQDTPAEQQQAEEISEEESKRQLHIRQNQYRGEL